MGLEQGLNYVSTNFLDLNIAGAVPFTYLLIILVCFVITRDVTNWGFIMMPTVIVLSVAGFEGMAIPMLISIFALIFSIVTNDMHSVILNPINKKRKREEEDRRRKDNLKQTLDIQDLARRRQEEALQGQQKEKNRQSKLVQYQDRIRELTKAINQNQNYPGFDVNRLNQMVKERRKYQKLLESLRKKVNM